MIYVTGDTHGRFDRFEYGDFTKDDIVVILGDAGFNYYCNSRDNGGKSIMSDMRCTFFCVHGNHECRPIHLKNYKTKEWNGGTVYYEDEYPNILFAQDGYFNIDGNKILVIGGAYSVDKYYRLRMGYKWFSDEQPDETIKAHIEEQINDMRDYDYIFTHTCPVSYEPVDVFLPCIDQSTVDKTTENWLETVMKQITYNHWYCGHYHTERTRNNHTFLYHSILKLGETIPAV